MIRKRSEGQVCTFSLQFVDGVPCRFATPQSIPSNEPFPPLTLSTSPCPPMTCCAHTAVLVVPHGGNHHLLGHSHVLVQLYAVCVKKTTVCASKQRDRHLGHYPRDQCSAFHLFFAVFSFLCFLKSHVHLRYLYVDMRICVFCRWLHGRGDEEEHWSLLVYKSARARARACVSE
jgi:hypothetical protein